MTVELTNHNFEQEVMQSDKPVLIDFWAPWCGPCQMFGPILDQVASENQNIKVGKVNIDEQPQLAQQYQVMSIPTIILFKNGKAVDTRVGMLPKQQLQEMLK